MIKNLRIVIVFQYGKNGNNLGHMSQLHSTSPGYVITVTWGIVGSSTTALKPDGTAGCLA